jgi:hypothetical protein
VTANRIRVLVETSAKRSFASALDWPGWSRGAKTAELAVEALATYEARYRPVAARAGHPLPGGSLQLDVVEAVEGDASTAFGVPSRLAEADRVPTTTADGDRLAAFVEAAWSTFDETAARAPEVLTKGPRGGGRDTSKIVGHAIGADQGYASQLGIRARLSDPPSRDEVATMRREMLAVIRTPSDGSPVTKRWTRRYAARRIAWHALDHAWEIEDRIPG